MSIQMNTKCVIDNFHDLRQSSQPEERIYHDFLILLLDQLFGQHDQIRIDMETETNENHATIKQQWKLIHKYYGVPDSAKYTQKCVRQTLIHIVNNINHRHGFIHPIKVVHKRHNFRDKITGQPTAKQWIELILF